MHLNELEVNPDLKNKILSRGLAFSAQNAKPMTVISLYQALQSGREKIMAQAGTFIP